VEATEIAEVPFFEKNTEVLTVNGSTLALNEADLDKWFRTEDKVSPV